MLTVTAAATDRTLLTLAELRAAAGATDDSRDTELITLGDRIESVITKACRVVAAGNTPPSLREETLSETLRLGGSLQQSLLGNRRYLVLARRPVISVASVTENDTLLDAAEYEYESGAGLLRRLSGDWPSRWPCGKIVIAYVAGWATVPDDLKLAATKFIQAVQQQGDRDPLLMSKTTEGIGSYSWKVDRDKDSIVPVEVYDILLRGGYVEPWM